MPKLLLSEATLEDAEARVGELRQEFVDFSEGRRTDSDLGSDAGKRSMLDEVDSLDTFITLSAAKMHAESAKALRIAGTMGPTADDGGFRSIGDSVGAASIMELAARDGAIPGMAVSQTTRSWTPADDRTGRILGPAQMLEGRSSLIASIELDGKEGRAASRWLRREGMYSTPDRESGMRAVTEFGSSGPSGFDQSDAGGLIPRLGQPIPPVPRQAKLYLRDLIPTMPTTFPIVPYVRELNPAAYEGVASGGASTVAEGSVKPTAQLSFVSMNAAISVVATTLTLSKQMMQDAPAVISYINQRLPYLVKLTEDAQFLSGSGTWPNIQGITNTPGIQYYTTGSSLDYAQDIGNGFALVEQQDGVPTAVVMNPIDAWYMFTKRAAGGAGTFDAGTPFSMLPLTIWGVPSYRSRVYPRSTSLVVDFDRGFMIADREAVNLMIYNERYAEQNLVLLICEERVGLLAFRPDLAVSVSNT